MSEKTHEVYKKLKLRAASELDRIERRDGVEPKEGR